MLEVDAGLDNLPGGPQNDPQFTLDLDNITGPGMALTLAQNPGAVKLLSDGTFAIGLNLDAGLSVGSFNRELGKFRNQFDTSYVSPSNRDWGLIVDQWIIDAYIRNIDLVEGRTDLRNMSQELKRIKRMNFFCRVASSLSADGKR